LLSGLTSLFNLGFFGKNFELLSDSRAINYISTEESAVAMFVSAENSFGITNSDLCLVTAHVFRFNRKDDNITLAMQKACEYLIETSTLASTQSTH